ncbi:MAG: hypothetical protein HQL02_04720 [Nitrospirae bacterium]|nr:hypothetical protein [Nitrospirota bacterium]
MKTLMILFGLLISQAIVVGSEPFFTAPGSAPGSTRGHSWLLTVAEAADSSFTQADRDRMIRMEDRMTRMEDRMSHLEERIIRVEEGLKAVNQRLDDSIKAINQKFDYLIGLIYVMLSGMFVLVGFILWDRRTTLAPVVRTTREIETQTEKLVLVLREKAAKDPELKEALKHAGLL